MPRISVTINLADQDKPLFSAENNNYDYCNKCYANIAGGDHAEAEGVSPEAECLDADHPEYDGFGDYECEECGKVLTREDN